MRFLGFLKEWGCLLLKIQGLVNVTMRILLVLFIVIPAIGAYYSLFALNEPIEMSWNIPSGGEWQYHISLGYGLAIIITISSILITAGPAWLLSAGPRLIMGDELEPDDRYKMYRLRITNQGGGNAEPSVFAKHVVTEDGTPLIPPVSLPKEMHWSDLKKWERPILLSGDSATSGITMIAIDPRLILTSMGIDEEIDPRTPWNHRRKVYFELEISCRNTRCKRISSWFGLEPNDSSPIGYSPIAKACVIQCKLMTLKSQGE